jgi:CDP-glycerol glycerophosphotransferase (TagB/SpsB family)
MLNALGYPAEEAGTRRGNRFTRSAGVAVFNAYPSDINAPLLGGAKLVNLWHGVGTKAMAYLSTKGKRALILKHGHNPLVRLAFYHKFMVPDVFLSTSIWMTQHFSNCFRYPQEVFVRSGYPRMDAAFDPDLANIARLSGGSLEIDELLKDGVNVAIYMPTWRDTDRPFLSRAIPDASLLNEKLREKNIILFVKLHPNTPSAEVDNILASNIKVWPTDADFYAYIGEVRYLITDYSSVLYDFLLIRDKGIILYTFDKDEYLAVDRDLVVPFDDGVVGVEVKSFVELCRAFVLDDIDQPVDAEKRNKLLDMFWGDIRGGASHDLTKQLCSKLGITGDPVEHV